MSYKTSSKYTGVQSYEKKNGDTSYYIRYEDESGKTVRKKIGDKSKGITLQYAFNKRNQIINTINLGEDPLQLKKKKSKIILNDIFEYYIQNKDMKEKSRKDANGRWNKHVKENLGKQDASYISVEDIRKLKSSIKLSERSKEIIIGYIYTAYEFCSAHNEDKFSQFINPMIAYRKIEAVNQSRASKQEKKRKRNRYLTLDEIKLLKNEVKDDFNLKLGVEVLLSTGQRANSALQIKKRDINLENNTISLIDEKVGGERYTGYITSTLRHILEKYLKDLKNNDYIFQKKNKQLTYSQFSKDLTPILIKLFNDNIDISDMDNRVVIHTLRHTFASHLAINSTSIYTIKKLMNHKDINSTIRYAKLSPENGKNDVEDLYK